MTQLARGRIRITRSARKHRIGNARILAAMVNAGAPAVDGDALVYVAIDDRGIELEIVAVPDDRSNAEAGDLAVIHVMPTAFRD